VIADLPGVPEEDRRREPGGDVLTGLATATFPDGSLPDGGDAVRVAVNLFAAGQETTVRRAGRAVQVVAEQPDLQLSLRSERQRISTDLDVAEDDRPRRVRNSVRKRP
jgi:cytochrome P450